MNLLSFVRRLQGERPGMSADSGWKWYGGYAVSQSSIQIQNNLRIADVSYYQGLSDFGIMKSAGIVGAIIRAGQRNWVDPRFRDNWQKAKQAGLPRGSYWLYDSREDPEKQASLWWSLIKDDPAELFLAADLEENYGGPYGKPDHFKAFLTRLQYLMTIYQVRIPIMIYTGYFWWAERVGNDPYFKNFPLWLPWYAAAEVVKVPVPWTDSDLLFWQYTSSGNGLAYGVSSKEIDLSWFCCDAIYFSQRFGVSVDVPTPPPGGSMWYRVNTSVLNVREGPGTSYKDIGDVLFDDLVETDDQSLGGWRRIRQVLRAGSPLDLPNPTSSYCKESYLVQVAAPVPPPAPDPAPSPFPAEIGITIGGITKQYVLKP